MTWKIIYRPGLIKSVGKLDYQTQDKIQNYLKKLSTTPNPENFGKPLSANLKGFWRYRVGDYRIICEIRKRELIILIIDIGHRSGIYKK